MQPLPQLVVDEQRLRPVPARRKDLHQQPVTGLTVPVGLDQGSSGSFPGGELAAADLEAGLGGKLQRAQRARRVAFARMMPRGSPPRWRRIRLVQLALENDRVLTY